MRSSPVLARVRAYSFYYSTYCFGTFKKYMDRFFLLFERGKASASALQVEICFVCSAKSLQDVWPGLVVEAGKRCFRAKQSRGTKTGGI